MQHIIVLTCLYRIGRFPLRVPCHSTAWQIEGLVDTGRISCTILQLTLIMLCSRGLAHRAHNLNVKKRSIFYKLMMHLKLDNAGNPFPHTQKRSNDELMDRIYIMGVHTSNCVNQKYSHRKN